MGPIEEPTPTLGGREELPPTAEVGGELSPIDREPRTGAEAESPLTRG